MSGIALDTIKAIRERLNEVITDLDRMEDALHNAPPGAIDEIELPKEALEHLPWKAYKSGNGSWIFSDLEEPTAKKLKEALVENQGTMDLHGVQYRFSGQDDRFIARYPRR